MKGERDRLILLTWDGTREEEVRVQQAVTRLGWHIQTKLVRAVQCHALSLKWAIECVGFEDRAFLSGQGKFRAWDKPVLEAPPGSLFGHYCLRRAPFGR